MHNGNAAAPVRVLLVGDDAQWAGVAADALRREDMSVLLADNEIDALTMAAEMTPQVIVLDLGMQKTDGLERCRRLRITSDVPIIVSTPRRDRSFATAAHVAGADDVLTRGTGSRELAARIRAVEHGRGGDASGRQVFGLLSVDVGRREVFVGDEQISLTRTQFDILATLAQRGVAVTTRQELLDAVWGPSWSGSATIIDVHIGQLRRRLGDNPARPLLVLNVRGIGYRLAG